MSGSGRAIGIRHGTLKSPRKTAALRQTLGATPRRRAVRNVPHRCVFLAKSSREVLISAPPTIAGAIGRRRVTHTRSTRARVISVFAAFSDRREHPMFDASYRWFL